MDEGICRDSFGAHQGVKVPCHVQRTGRNVRIFAALLFTCVIGADVNPEYCLSSFAKWIMVQIKR